MARRKRRMPFWSSIRIQSSLFATAIMHLNLFGISLKKFCTPGFNCHACAWSTCACPIGVVAYGAANRTLPVLAISTLVAIGIVFGRLVCAFVCPFGFFQDLLHRIPSPKLKLPRFLNYGRYLALVLLVFVLPFAFGFRTESYASVVPVSGGFERSELTVTVENPGDAPIHGLDLLVEYVWYDEDDREHVAWTMNPPPSFPDLVVPAGGEVAIDPFMVRLMESIEVEKEVDGEVVKEKQYLDLQITPRGHSTGSVRFDDRSVKGEMVEVAITVQNLSTEPVKGVPLKVEWVDEEDKYPVHEVMDLPDFGHVEVLPGETVALDLFWIKPMRTHVKEGEELPTKLFVSSPLMDIRPEIGDFQYFCNLCPTATLTVTIPSLLGAPRSEEEGLGFVYRAEKKGLRLGVLAAFLVLMIVSARPFCRVACPLGAIYSLFNRMSFVTMKIDDTCNDCGTCSKHCPLDLDVAKDLGGADCIQCGDCIPACPHGSISRMVAFPSPRLIPKSEGPPA